ncbi:MAG: PEP-CTERM sorting domain-containing protein [Bryobacterales bacterium]|nr:PEP-CTERM sorting domain-containing protein [Bryobacterales bacterium]
MKLLTAAAVLSMAMAGTAPAALLFDNGPMVTGPAAGPGGTDLSVVQESIGLRVLGANGRLADNFVVPVGQEWLLNSVVLFGYQTGSTLTSTITGVTVRIWDGAPGAPGSNVIFGDIVTNRLLTSTFSGIYRVPESNQALTNRPVMENTASLGVTLGEGEYWIDYQLMGSLTSGPWTPPVTVVGQTTTGDGWRTDSQGLFIPFVDSNLGTGQGVPFLLDGVVVPEPSTFAAIGLGLLALGLRRPRPAAER